MPRYIALLRAINVGGRNRLTMATLRQMLCALEFENVQTLLQSGNVVFDAARTKSAMLETRLERETTERLGLNVDYLVRTQRELETALAQNPFYCEAMDDPAHTALMFLKRDPTAQQVDALRSTIRGREKIAAVGRHLYIVYPDGMGTSKFNGTRIEKCLATHGTMRNWNTLLKLAALADA